MKRLLLVWDRLRSDMWPVPLGMLLLGAALFGGAVRIDAALPADFHRSVWWLHKGSGDDARNLMSTLLTAIITMSSVVFSITIVALSLAANQFGSRLVRIYMTDVRTKLSLGLFTMTIVYCLLALALLEKDMTTAEVPHVTVTFGAVLALACVLTLLFFLHRVARSVIADEVIRRVGRELEETIASLPPLDTSPEAGAGTHDLEVVEERSAPLRSPQEGYVQAVEYERLAAVAQRHNVVVRLDIRPGAFVTEGGSLGVSSSPANSPEHALTELQSCVVIGRRRTPTQDLEFSMRHLVDVALRALSPGINDANTALVVIDRLRGSLARLLGKALPAAVFRDADGVARVLAKANSYGDLLDAALHQIRQAAAEQPAVVINLIDALGKLAEHARLPSQREALARHADLAAAAGLRATEEPRDRSDIEEALSSTLAKLRPPIQTSARAGT